MLLRNGGRDAEGILKANADYNICLCYSRYLIAQVTQLRQGVRHQCSAVPRFSSVPITFELGDSPPLGTFKYSRGV